MTPNFGFEQRCRFPVVALYYDGDMTVWETFNCMTLCAKSDLKAGQRGRYAQATILDSEGLAWEMDGARKLHGVGPLWGYNIFFNQTIRVQPTIVGEPKQVEINTAKREVIKRLRKTDAVTLHLANFCTTIEQNVAQRTVPLIEAASSVREIINELLAMDFPERASLQAAGS